MKKKTALIFADILLVISFTLALLSVWVMLNTERGKAPSALGYSLLLIQSGSMEPTLSVGGLLLVHTYDFDKVEAGDIVSFYSADPNLNGKLNTHRVVERRQTDTGSVLITKGDANYVDDAYPVTEEQFLGKVVYHSAILGVLLSLIRGKGTVFLIIIPLLILIISCGIKIKRLMREERARLEEELRQELLAERGEDTDETEN